MRKDSPPIRVEYKNWRGEVAIRKIIPISVKYGRSKFHEGEQWLLEVWDVDKSAKRTFALKDIQKWMM